MPQYSKLYHYCIMYRVIIFPLAVSPLPSGQGSEGGGAYVEGSDSVSSLTNTPVTTTTRKQVKLSIDQLMPVNIRPKVCNYQPLL